MYQLVVLGGFNQYVFIEISFSRKSLEDDGNSTALTRSGLMVLRVFLKNFGLLLCPAELRF